MNPFLKQVAGFLYQQHGKNIDQISVVFPGRRSGVFFNAYLNGLVKQPVLGPEVLTIDELVSQVSGLQISDQINLILRLHQIYIRETGHPEQLDDFFFWGEILLNDFNDIDKYLLDAGDLFRNISDLKEIDIRFDYLSPRQRQAAEMFWGNLGRSGSSINRDKFLNIWNKLNAVYDRFRTELLNEGVGYSGMVYRSIIEMLNQDGKIPLQSDRYVFVGFNALNACEEQLFQWFRSAGKADFFWDYDERFVSDQTHEAGLFVRKNLIRFPMPANFVADPEPSLLKRLQVVAVPGQVAQAQVINQHRFFTGTTGTDSFDEAALVLADESMLIPVVSAAGCISKSINITMGYPLQDTPVYSLIDQLISLQKDYRKIDGEDTFYHRPVLAVLNHQLIAGPETLKLVREIRTQNKILVRASDMQEDELLRLIFQRPGKWQDAAAWFLSIIRKLAVRLPHAEDQPAGLDAEYLYQTYLALQRLVDTLNMYQPGQMSLPLFYRIFLRHLQRINIPFEGEPLSGLQVMGVLETRTLDFKKLILFSVNEGKLPKTSAVHSFIPYNLRKAFGLPAYEEQDAMYAYYFYRLLHRAEEVVLVYDSSTDGLNTGEMSRYIFQLRYNSGYSPELCHFDFDFRASGSRPISVPGTSVHQQRLLERYSVKPLTPSALNTYLDCRLKFYFRHLAGLKESDEVLEEIDPRLFGNLFHHAAELIYSDFKGKQQVTRDDLKVAASNPNRIGKAVRLAFAREYLKDKSLKDVPITGKNMLIAENLRTYLEKMLENDMNFAPFTILDLEGHYEAPFRIRVNGAEHQIVLGGVIDRIDQTAEGVRIVDYKTGRNLVLKFTDFSEFYNREKDRRPKEIFQTLVYSEIYRRTNGSGSLYPAIYKIDEFFRDDFRPEIRQNNQVVNYPELSSDFVVSLESFLEEIFSAENVYDQTIRLDHCRLCPYNSICRRS
ncbi:MAG: PD-(D/E)XK nuclease family protein [Prolixibacteraceae bacterium]